MVKDTSSGGKFAGRVKSLTGHWRAPGIGL